MERKREDKTEEKEEKTGAKNRGDINDGEGRKNIGSRLKRKLTPEIKRKH